MTADAAADTVLHARLGIDVGLVDNAVLVQVVGTGAVDGGETVEEEVEIVERFVEHAAGLVATVALTLTRE